MTTDSRTQQPGPAAGIRRSIGYPRLGLAIALLGLLGLVFVADLKARTQAERQGDQAARSVLLALLDNVGRAITAMDHSLQTALEVRNVPGFESLPREYRQRLLFQQATTIDGLGAVIMLDTQGNIEYDSLSMRPRAGNFADRADFLHHQGRPDDGALISGPYDGRAGLNERILVVSRRREDEQGRFVGTIAGAIRLSAFRSLFERMNLGEQTLITMHDGDGVIIMRVPYAARHIGSRLIDRGRLDASQERAEVDSFIDTSPIDQVERQMVWGTVPDTRLRIGVGIATSTIRDSWMPQATVASGLALAFIGYVGWSFWRLNAEHRQRQMAERQFRVLAENSFDIITRTNRYGERVYVSPSCLTILGYGGEELTGASAQKHYYPGDYEVVRAAAERLRRGESVNEVIHLRVYRRDGNLVTFESTMSAIYSDGEYDGHVGVNRDITKRLEQELATQRIAIEVERIGQRTNLAALSSGLAHEIQQPLAVATNYAGALNRTLQRELDRLSAPSAAVVQQATTGIQAAMLRAGDIVRTIRALAAPSPRRLEVVTVQSLVAAAIRLVRIASHEDHVPILVAIGTEVTSVRVDEIQLQQVLYNLLVNAVEASRAEPAPRVEIAAQRQEDGRIAITVTDNGIGVAPEMRQRLFEAFNTSKPAGMGIGLSICRTIVEAHAGSIELVSSVPGATCFRILLPEAENIAKAA